MKKTIFILSLFFFASVLLSCNKNSFTETNNSSLVGLQKKSSIKESDVPPGVVSRFNQLYPSTNVKSWDLIDGNYLASFTLNNISMSVLFAASGYMIETTTEILESQLPKSCTDYCAKNYAGKKIKSSARIDDAAGRVFYKVDIDKTLLLLDSSGNFVRIIV